MYELYEHIHTYSEALNNDTHTSLMSLKIRGLETGKVDLRADANLIIH